MTGAEGEVPRMPFDAVARQHHRMTDGAIVDGGHRVDAGVEGNLRWRDLVLAEMERGDGGLLAGTRAGTPGEPHCHDPRRGWEKMGRRPEGGSKPPARGGGDGHCTIRSTLSATSGISGACWLSTSNAKKE